MPSDQFVRPTGPPGSTVTVRAVSPDDADAWLDLRHALWPGSETTREAHRREITRFLAGGCREPLEVLLAVDGKGRALGLAELSIRAYAQGCHSDRVAYVEGWYVVPEARRRGVGRTLIAAAEKWGRSQGCRELASDTEPDNIVSAAAHGAAGFQEAGLMRCFRKNL